MSLRTFPFPFPLRTFPCPPFPLRRFLRTLSHHFCYQSQFLLYIYWGAASQQWCIEFSLRWILLLQRIGARLMGSVVMAPRSLWNLPRPGIEPMSAAWAGGFWTTGPPGKSISHSFYHRWISQLAFKRVRVCSLAKSCPTHCEPMTAVCQALLSMGHLLINTECSILNNGNF